jgi:CheY-like chemotaxis protein
MDDYVTKPIRVPELQAALERTAPWLQDHITVTAPSDGHRG